MIRNVKGHTIKGLKISDQLTSVPNPSPVKVMVSVNEPLLWLIADIEGEKHFKNWKLKDPAGATNEVGSLQLSMALDTGSHKGLEETSTPSEGINNSYISSKCRK